MPIYEYQCDGCSEVFEVFQKVSDPAPTQHSCGSTAVHRVLSNTSFVLKGSGWYITDYGRKSQGNEGGSSGGGAKAAKKDGGEAESKSNSASDAKKASGDDTAKSSKPASDSGAKGSSNGNTPGGPAAIA